jgi:hypothetical protein
MDMPQIAESKDNSSIEETISDLLVSAAAEEIALANLMNATAETIQALATMISNPDIHSQTKDINFLCKSINKTLETVIMKEWILSKKLDNIFDIMIDYNSKMKKRKKNYKR